jgi:hypothetical protein
MRRPFQKIAAAVPVLISGRGGGVMHGPGLPTLPSARAQQPGHVRLVHCPFDWSVQCPELRP